jgi:protein SCO1/2
MKKGFSLFLIIVSFLTAFEIKAEGLPYKEKKTADEKIESIAEVGIEEHIGAKLNLNADLIDEDGKPVKLGKYFDGKRPVLLTMVYFSCPSLCNYHLNGLTDVMRQMQWTTGKEFDLVAISFEPKDTPEIAKNKKANYLKEYARESGEKGWHFLTGTEENVGSIAKQLGFSYKWEEETQQWAHAAVAYVMTPEGAISRYLYGIGFEPQTMKLSLVEASKGQIGSIVDKFVLYCFNYNPKERKYSLVAFNAVRAGAGAVVFALGLFLIPFWIRQVRKKKSV